MEQIIEILTERLFNSPENITKSAIPVAYMIASALISGATTYFGAKKANDVRKEAAQEVDRVKKSMDNVKNKRPSIINPYAGVTSLSGMIKNLSGGMSNAFNALSVATNAAEYQAEQTDIALANTLDLLQTTGASAGGATALAQAALQSKKDISASLEAQEVNNQAMRLQAEQNLQTQRLQENIRVQGAQFGEAARIQSAGAAGAQYVYEETADRNTADLNRLSAELTGTQVTQAQARSDQNAILAAGAHSVTQIVSQFGQTTAAAAENERMAQAVENAGRV